MPRPGRFTPGKDPVPIALEAGWASGPVLTDAEKFASTGIRSPNRPVRSQSLYRLSYCGPLAYSSGLSGSLSYYVKLIFNSMYSFFLNIARRRLVVVDRRFGATYLPNVRESYIPIISVPCNNVASNSENIMWTVELEPWGIHSAEPERSLLLGYDVTLLGNTLLTFRSQYIRNKGNRLPSKEKSCLSTASQMVECLAKC
jgi:hypothetical protein